MKLLSTDYARQDDGSGIITETYDDGTQRIMHLAPPMFFDSGPTSMKRIHRELLQRREDEITRLDRRDHR